MAHSVIAPRILCIGIPVRDLTFRVETVPARGSKANASHLAEICGGNALNARDRHRAAWRPRLLRGPHGRCRGDVEPLHPGTDGS